jgi:hypothetical protein
MVVAYDQDDRRIAKQVKNVLHNLAAKTLVFRIPKSSYHQENAANDAGKGDYQEDNQQCGRLLRLAEQVVVVAGEEKEQHRSNHKYHTVNKVESTLDHPAAVLIPNTVVVAFDRNQHEAQTDHTCEHVCNPQNDVDYVVIVGVFPADLGMLHVPDCAAQLAVHNLL